MAKARKFRSTQELLDSAQRKLAAAQGEVDSRKRRVAELRARDRREERKREDRRKILWGALVQKYLADPETNQDTRDWWNQKLDKFLTRPEERALFGLPPLPETQSLPAPARVPASPPSTAPELAAQPAAGQAPPGAQGGTAATATQPPAQPAPAQPQPAHDPAPVGDVDATGPALDFEPGTFN